MEGRRGRMIGLYVITLLMVILIALMYWSLRVYTGKCAQRVEDTIARLEKRLLENKEE